MGRAVWTQSRKHAATVHSRPIHPHSNPCPCPHPRVRSLRTQVLSGSLEPSPARSSEAFWREHAGRFEEGNCQLIRVLVKLLEARRVALRCDI